jgi:hypothetical protein
MCKSWVYDAVQAAAEKVSGLKRQEVFAEIRTPAMERDVTNDVVLQLYYSFWKEKNR